jgi:dTMP kinase
MIRGPGCHGSIAARTIPLPRRRRGLDSGRGETPVVTSLKRRSGRGTFITFEGPEGAGKTSQAAKLRDVAAKAGLDVLLTREPGGTWAGERIRELLLATPSKPPVADVTATIDARTAALLFNAARAQLVVEVIEPALARGELVIATRFADSTLAYQGSGEGLGLDELRVLERFATGGLKPDLTILLDLPAEVGLSRKSGVEVTRFESGFDLAFHRRVREGFLALATAEPRRFAVIDATRPTEVVFQDVLEAAMHDLNLDLAPLGARGRGGAREHAPSEPEAREVRIHR